MASRVVTQLAGVGMRALGSVLKGAGSLVQKAGKSSRRGTARDSPDRSDDGHGSAGGTHDRT